MLQILKDTEQRLVMRLGDRKLRWTKLVLDKDAGFAWVERGRRLLPQRTLVIPLAEIAAIESETTARGSTGLIKLTTRSNRRYWLAAAAACTQDAADRLRSFVGVTEQAAPALSPRRGFRNMRAGQAAAAIAMAGGAIWLVAQFGGLVAGAAANTGGFIAERLQSSLLLPACDAQDSRTAIEELVRDRLGSGAVLANIVERGQSGGERLCAATARRDGRTANVSYRSYRDGWTPKVQLAGEIVTLKLDTARTAAIARAIETFLAASQNSARSGQAPRQTDQAIDNQLSIIFGASDLAAEPLAPAEIDKALAWLKAADRVGAVYLLAGTGFDDFATVPRTDAIQKRLRANVVTFDNEFGRYADFQMIVLAAVANAQMRAMTGTKASGWNGTIEASGDEVRAQLSQAMRSNFIALVYDGHNDAWRMARLTALGRAAPVAAKFLTREEAAAVRELALRTVGYFRDAAVQARVREVAGLLAAR